METHRNHEVRRAPSIIVAEFDSAHDVLHAAEKVRDAGYEKWDTHTPFPVHGMDKAMGLGDSRLGWIVITCAITGLTGAFVMMHWMNGIDYELIVGDKPGGAPGTLPEPGPDTPPVVRAVLTALRFRWDMLEELGPAGGAGT